MYPEDVDPQSGYRLPLPRREELDEAGQRTYDSLADPKGGTIRGLRGPGGIMLHSPELSRHAGRSTAICVTRRDWEDAPASWLFSPPPVTSTANSNGRRTSRKQSPRVFPERSSTSSSIAEIRAAWTRPMRS